MTTRRQMLLGFLSLAAMAGKGAFAPALGAGEERLDWPDFVSHMRALALRHGAGQVAPDELERQGLALLSRLDITTPAFRQAEAQAFESGNAFWFWQRMLRHLGVDGGILTVERSQMIPLHDHPGATGMVRVISGEVEVWKFRRVDAEPHAPGEAQLKRVFRGILRPGDTATVSPTGGNIHALRAISPETRMLDFFIPPFDRRSVLFYEPHKADWFGEREITCRAIPRLEYLFG